MFGPVYMSVFRDDEMSFRGEEFNHFCIDSLCTEDSFQHYFGPSNLKQVFDFCRIIDTQMLISRLPLLLIVSADNKIVTRAVFLVGAYMIVVLKTEVTHVISKIS